MQSAGALGIFLGAKRFGGRAQKDKRTLILDVEPYRYQRFVSDLAGMDIHAHAGDPFLALRETRDWALRETRDWLANVSGRTLPSGRKIEALDRKFLDVLPALAANLDFDPDAIPYSDFQGIVVAWLLQAADIPE